MRRSLTLLASAVVLTFIVVTAASANLLTVHGRITGIQGKGRTIMLRAEGADLILQTDAATLVTVRGTEKTPAALKPGNTVRVKYAPVHGRNVAAEISIETD